MERDFERELMDVKRNIGELRDKVILAKAMMEQSENQISTHVENIEKLLIEERGEEFRAKTQPFMKDLSSEETAAQLFEWIECYLNDMKVKNSEVIDSLKDKIELWKSIIS